MVYLGLIGERLPLWLLPLAALLSLRYPALALLLFFVAYAVHGFGAGAIAPAWADLVANCFPVNRRGRFFGFSSFVGTGLGTLGALFSGWLLESYPFPTNFAYIFLIAAVSIVFSFFFIAMTREPTRPVPQEILAQRGQAWRKISNVIRTDLNFQRFLLAQLCSNMGRMAMGFLTVVAIQRWDISDSTVGIYTALLMVGQTTGKFGGGIYCRSTRA